MKRRESGLNRGANFTALFVSCDIILLMSRALKPLNFILTIFSLSVLFFAGYKFVIETEAADPLNHLTGWAWSSNVGWISLNCSNEDTCASSDYKVTVDPFIGVFAGYAWNGVTDPTNNPGVRGGIGWIRFDPPGPYPEPPNHFAKVVNVTTSNGTPRAQVQGWIRVCAPANDPIECEGEGDPLALNNGNWAGWIKMSGDTTNCPAMANPSPGSYETCVTADGQSLEGWAWGGEVVGWLQFKPETNNIIIPAGSTKICEIKPGGPPKPCP